MSDHTPTENGDQQPSDETDRRAQAVGIEEPPRLSFAVVGIGGSAGGLEACIEFFRAAPADTGMAFVFIQHLAPDRHSLIAEILSKNTAMKVQQIEDGMQVEANHVYVIRPGSTTTIKDGRLHLGARLETPGHHRPVDDFFRSLAEEQRERAIGVILSGMGSNGSAGAQMIKAVGGFVVAQDLDTAQFPSMPRHLIDSGNADFILTAREMPAVLMRFATHAYASRRDSAVELLSREQQRFKEILAVLRTRVRQDYSGYKKPTILRRIQRRMGLNQVDTLAEYLTILRQSPPEATALSDDLMIHVTGFFRDPEAWEALKERVIVPLVNERQDGSSIRGWVTACSSGEEAYTLAILVAEVVEASGKSFDVKIFATDTAERTLSQARNGLYPLGIEAEVSEHRLARFFDRDDALYRVKKELRQCVVFAPQNVVLDPPFSRLDICTCRNLLIYLEPQLQRRVLSLVHFGLRDGGALLLGNSETPGTDDLFEPLDKKHRIYRRNGAPRHGMINLDHLNEWQKRGEREAPAGLALKSSISQVTSKALLEQFTPAAVTVDRQHRAVFFHGNTDPFLTQPTGEPTQDIQSLVRLGLRGALRSCLQKAVEDNQKTVADDGFIQGAHGRQRVELTVIPLDSKLSPGHLLISFKIIERETSAAPGDAKAAEKRDAATLDDELRRVKEELQSTIEELQTSNEEMKASNEEVMSINEELQSTNEELETSKEELQSMNEELRTVNSQLQSKMEELEASTNDLNSLLSSTDIGVVFLDMEFRIRRFTARAKDHFELIPTDIGRPISDLHRKFIDPDLMSDLTKVIADLIPLERQTVGAQGRTYMRRILPYRTSDHHIRGVVITFVDVSELRRAVSALGASEDRLRVVFDAVPDFAIVLINADGMISAWNRGAEQLLGYTAAQAIGQHISLIFMPEERFQLPQAEMAEAAATGRAVLETWRVRSDGQRVWCRGVLTAISDVLGNVAGFVKILRDETPLKRAEQERAALLVSEQAARREAESATRQKDQFLAMLSHELRTPLSAILMSAKLMLRNLDDSPELAETLQIIERSAQSQRQLLDDLLDTTRIASGKMHLELKKLELVSLIQAVVDDFKTQAAEKHIEVQVHVSDDAIEMVADPARVRQIMANLLANSLKFTPNGGKVAIKIAKVDDMAEIRVTDSGVGIDPNYLPHVFTAFSQADNSSARSYGGLGLGLAISRQLTELHGGSIIAKSEGRDQGATFVVRLPLLSSDALPHVEENVKKSNTVSVIPGVTVLVVEDDTHSLQALTKLLSGAGARVTAAASVTDAIETFHRARPQIIVSDIGMPGKDGYELMQEIRTWEAEQHQPPTPAIALSAFATRTDRRKAREAGYQEHLAKPVDFGDLLATIERLVKGH